MWDLDYSSCTVRVSLLLAGVTFCYWIWSWKQGEDSTADINESCFLGKKINESCWYALRSMQKHFSAWSPSLAFCSVGFQVAVEKWFFCQVVWPWTAKKFLLWMIYSPSFLTVAGVGTECRSPSSYFFYYLEKWKEKSDLHPQTKVKIRFLIFNYKIG